MKDVINHFNRSWSSRRGIETTDYNAKIVFARAPVERFAAALATHAVEWNKHVLGREVVVASAFGFVFRLSGHPWSLFVESGSSIGVDEERTLSHTLDAPVIEYICSDTTSVHGYELFEGGRTVEIFGAQDDQVTEFRSSLRDRGIADGSNPYKFLAQFLVDHDVYEPGIPYDYFFSDGHVGPTLVPGSRRKVRNPGFFLQTFRPEPAEVHSTPHFERVDYLVFKR